jgi:hypothetical protein
MGSCMRGGIIRSFPPAGSARRGRSLRRVRAERGRCERACHCAYCISIALAAHTVLRVRAERGRCERACHCAYCISTALAAHTVLRVRAEPRHSPGMCAGGAALAARRSLATRSLAPRHSCALRVMPCSHGKISVARSPGPTQNSQGWPRIWVNSKAFIGIFSQTSGSSYTFWANPVGSTSQASATPTWTRAKEPWPRSFPPCGAQRWSNPRVAA